MPSQPLPLPHQGAARLIDETVDADKTSVRCIARIPQNSPFRPQGGTLAPSFLVVEMAAQAGALLIERADDATDQRDDGPAGYIAAVRDIALPHHGLDVNASFEIHASMQTSAPPLFIVTFTAASNGKTIGSGTLTLALA